MKNIFPPVLLILLLGCEKQDSTVFQNPPSDSFYFKATINSEAIKWSAYYTNGKDASYLAGTSLGSDSLSSNCVNGFCSYSIAYTNLYSNNVATMPQINVGYSNAMHTGNKVEMMALFVPGSKTFGKYRTSQQLLDSSKNGINIYYIDKDHKAWSSLKGDQTGSMFESVSLEDEKRRVQMPMYEKKWKARFTCKLYDEQGNFIKIDSAEIYGPLFPK
ncbi:MAG: hypothetical protein ACXVLF_16905 [Flavisolibacter sp.]